MGKRTAEWSPDYLPHATEGDSPEQLDGLIDRLPVHFDCHHFTIYWLADWQRWLVHSHETELWYLYPPSGGAFLFEDLGKHTPAWRLKDIAIKVAWLDPSAFASVQTWLQYNDLMTEDMVKAFHPVRFLTLSPMRRIRGTPSDLTPTEELGFD